MNDFFEKDRFEKVKEYLIKLGYSGKSIFFEYTTESDRRIDIVVKIENKIFLLIEVKSKSSLNFDFPEEIGYHPITRRLQKDAKELDVQYYMISNGENHIWLQTSVTGRPEAIKEIPFSQFGVSNNSNPYFIKDILEQIKKFLKFNGITHNLQDDVSLVLYTKLLRECNINEYTEDYYVAEHKQRILERAIYYLDQEKISLINHKEDVILFIDELFKVEAKEWNVPRWLADFIFKIININPNNYIVDLFARNGVITSSAFINNNLHVISQCINKQELRWSKIYQLLFNNNLHETVFNSTLIDGNINLINNSVDIFIIAPPFNLKIDDYEKSELYYSGITDSTSIYIAKALELISENGKVVAIVPDNILISSKFKKARKFLKSKSHIESIISLPQRLFYPHSLVKTSLIILSKKNNNNNLCFMASIDKEVKIKSLNSLEDNVLKTIVKTKNELYNNKNIEFSKSGFLVHDLDLDNFHFSKYWLNNQKNEEIKSGFQLIPLKELILELTRGTTIKIDQSGEIPFINPANIRSMKFIDEELHYTTKDKLPKIPKIVKEGQILINLIGTYRGTAVLVPEEFNGLNMNGHVASITPNLNLVDTGYLVFALNSDFVQKQFIENSYGVTIPSLNLKSFEEIFIPLPNREEQKRIYDKYIVIKNKINNLKSNINQLETLLEKELKYLVKEEI